MTEDLAPVAYAAACFAEAGQVHRARVLAEHVRDRGGADAAFAPWLSLVDAMATRAEVGP